VASLDARRPKGLVILPTYNEAENIGQIIPAILESSDLLDVLVVDDASPDQTGQIVEEISQAEPRVHLISRPRKLGLGTAYIAGFRYGLEHGYDLLFEMDADFSHNPADLARFIEALKSYDLVIGARYLKGVSVVGWPLSRLLLSFFANLYARWVTGAPISDLTSGFKGYRRAVLEGIDLDQIRSDGYGFQIEIDYFIWRKGYRIKELPICFTERRSGSSKLSHRIVGQAFFLVWRLRLDSILGRI
jgi:dolichol-phosphate mannosyltransferase